MCVRESEREMGWGLRQRYRDKEDISSWPSYITASLMVPNPVEDSAIEERRGREGCATRKPLPRDIAVAV